MAIECLSIDYKALFSRVLYEEMCEAFARHGIDEIPEDEFESIVIEITKSEYMPSIAELRRRFGLTTLDPSMRFRW